MKKICSLLLILSLIIPVVALADIDLSGLSFNELLVLREQIAQELTTRPEWKEVTVPIGVWKVGEDIPAGHWTVSAVDGGISMVVIGTALDITGYEIDSWNSDFYFWKQIESANYHSFNPISSISSFDFTFMDGYYLIVSNGPAVFSPYIGKPSLGF